MSDFIATVYVVWCLGAVYSATYNLLEAQETSRLVRRPGHEVRLHSIRDPPAPLTINHASVRGYRGPGHLSLQGISYSGDSSRWKAATRAGISHSPLASRTHGLSLLHNPTPAG